MPPSSVIAERRTYAVVDGARTLIAVEGQRVPKQFEHLIGTNAVIPEDSSNAAGDDFFQAAYESEVAEHRKTTDEAVRRIDELRASHAAELARLGQEHEDAANKASDAHAAEILELSRIVQQLEAKFAALEPATSPVAGDQAPPVEQTPQREPKPQAPADGDKAKPAPEHDKARRGARTKGEQD